MNRHLNLVESDFEKMEKITLPRFPFCYLTFKDEAESSHIFEVKDISKTGMQICLKNGDHGYKGAQDIKGHLSWINQKIDIGGQVKWVSEKRVGVEFIKNSNLKESLSDFLSLSNFANALKPVHQVDYGTELPTNLKFWLSSDGPVQIMVWTHQHGEVSNFQVLIMEHFIEWIDGDGLRTGRVMSKRDKDTPLLSTDEFVFSIDEYIDDSKIELGKSLISKLDSSKIPSETLDFLKLKIGI